jgi:hypothetical protein
LPAVDVEGRGSAGIPGVSRRPSATTPCLSFRVRELATSSCESEALQPVIGRTRPGRIRPNDAFPPW